MYEQFYGFSLQPFELTPNPRFLLLTPTHREALSTLEYGISSRKAITLLIGEAGMGKTTLLRKALAIKLGFGATVADCVYINNPTLTSHEFFERLALDFGLGDEARTSKTILLRRLEQKLAARRVGGYTSALIVDEAQSLPDELIEELRLLANIESDDEKLLPLVLAGQPELAERLNDHHLRQFKQRVVLRCRLQPLDMQETATYIYGRIKLAGGDCVKIFTREAIMAVYAASGGVPRTISVVCDNALLSGFAQECRPITAEIVEEVCRDLEIAGLPPAALIAMPEAEVVEPDEAAEAPPTVRSLAEVPRPSRSVR
jgi:general secretion pathway protein A